MGGNVMTASAPAKASELERHSDPQCVNTGPRPPPTRWTSRFQRHIPKNFSR